jgi:hypothetical protein
MTRCELRSRFRGRSSGASILAPGEVGALKLWTTARVAEEIGFSQDWVRDHAAELGGIRMGHPTRGQLRFEPPRIEAYKQRRQLPEKSATRQRSRRRPGRRRVPTGVPLLPLPGDIPQGR